MVNGCKLQLNTGNYEDFLNEASGLDGLSWTPFGKTIQNLKPFTFKD